MNYYSMTSEELWKALRDVDAAIKGLDILDINDLSYNHHHEMLMEERLQIINTFVDGHGYNPDNLCVMKVTDPSTIKRIEELRDEKVALLDKYGLFGGGMAVQEAHARINAELESLGMVMDR